MFDNLRNRLNFDDLLFERRNREYGAYQLRRRYNAVVTWSIIAASLIFILSVAIPFLVNPRDEKVLIAGSGHMVPMQMENLEIPEEIYVPPAAPPPPKTAVQEIVQYTPPIVVDSVLSPTEMLPTAEELESIPVNDEIEITGAGSGEDWLAGDGIGSADDPFFIVEVLPSFKGGDINEFRRWVLLRTIYPQEAIDKNVKGKVFLTFVVEKDGSVSNVTVLQGVDPLIDNEAVKTIQSSPKWSPGLQRGRPVRFRYKISLNFTL